ncbi:hypothetical protein MCUN1_000074 [Malassezia cuniculi]|uniref:Uncharacterized protein n=1 Tax=Malassezia cuniculi TaxID=948313 RepID=A0AAF0EMX5_9BASI|nr:hypothetical protein MCUN1_000074 [Malassezia cuniculi]
MRADSTAGQPPSSLSDLSLAVFLDSLQTLEIAPSDGLTESMLESPLTLQTPDTMSEQNQDMSMAYAESVAMRQDLAYTVPADMSWWNIAWTLPDTIAQQPVKEEPTRSLLISTALQIYARALQIVRNVLVGNEFKCTCASGQPCSCDGDGEKRLLDVSIGGFRPSARHARKIAMYAMKLELHDLERALARVSVTAQSTSIPVAEANTGALRINPVDQLVIRKLHQQLGEMLCTVETLQ